MLKGCAITAVLHCAPPANRPSNEEICNCFKWFEKTLEVIPTRVYLALGVISWNTIIKYARKKMLHSTGISQFRHGAITKFNDGSFLLASYHPSQQNVFTGRLTEEMFDDILVRARNLLQIAK